MAIWCFYELDSFTITFIDHNKLDDIIMSSSRKPDRLVLKFGDIGALKELLTLQEKFIGKPYLTNLDAVGLEVDTNCRFISISEIKGTCSNSDAIKRKALNEKNKDRVWNQRDGAGGDGEHKVKYKFQIQFRNETDRSDFLEKIGILNKGGLRSYNKARSGK